MAGQLELNGIGLEYMELKYIERTKDINDQLFWSFNYQTTIKETTMNKSVI